jgi:hypothetical protein
MISIRRRTEEGVERKEGKNSCLCSRTTPFVGFSGGFTSESKPLGQHETQTSFEERKERRKQQQQQPTTTTKHR